MNKSQMTIGKKLILSFGAMIALVIGLGYSSLSAIGTLSAELETAVNSSSKKLDWSGQLMADMSDMLSLERGVAVRAASNDTAAVERFRRDFNAKAAEAEQDIKELRPLLLTETGKRATDKMEAGLVAWQATHQEFLELCRTNRDVKVLADFIAEKLLPLNDQVQRAGGEVMQQQRDLMATSARAASDETARAHWTALALIALCLLVGGGVLFVVRQIRRVLHRLAGEMAEGAEQVASAAAQVSASSQALAQGASEQAASLEETSSSSEEINSMTRKNAENSQSAAEFTSQVDQRVAEANRTLDHMVASMREINSSSEKISKIIKVIDEIAFQTNILALNAAVEAARAGEAGMGFAVVADEVRNLAQRCAQAAKDTAGLIEESITKSNDGSAKLDQVAESIRSITESVARVKALISEVNSSSQEQARGVEQIAKAIAQMEQVTQKTAANAEESASASEELSAQAEAMHAVVEDLQSMVGGGEDPGRIRGQKIAQPRSRSRATGLRARPDAAHDLAAIHAAVAKPASAALQPRKTSAIAPSFEKGAFALDEEFKEF